MNYVKDTFNVFLINGLFVYLTCRAWYACLEGWAARYDVEERRRRAAKLYPAILFLALLPALAMGYGLVVSPHRKLMVVSMIAYIISFVPAAIWWFRQMPKVYAMGYGRQKR